MLFYVGSRSAYVETVESLLGLLAAVADILALDKGERHYGLVKVGAYKDGSSTSYFFAASQTATAISATLRVGESATLRHGIVVLRNVSIQSYQ